MYSNLQPLPHSAANGDPNRVNSACQIFSECRVDSSVLSNAGFSNKVINFDRDVKMALAGPVIACVPRVTVTVISNIQLFRRKSGLKSGFHFLFN